MEALVIVNPQPLPASVVRETLNHIPAQDPEQLLQALRDDLVQLVQSFLQSRSPSDANRKVTILVHEDSAQDEAIKKFADRCSASPAHYAGSLGAALTVAIESAFDRGARRALVLSSWVPSLPVQILDHAFRALRFHPRVLGPDMAGFAYMLGFSRTQSLPVDELTWEPMPSVKEIQSIWGSSAQTHWLPYWYQLGDREQLRMALLHQDYLLSRGKVSRSLSLLSDS